jgi:hypothetical protein
LFHYGPRQRRRGESMTRMVGGLLAATVVGAVVAGCATGPVYTKKTDGESAAIDILDCNKAAIVAYRATRKRFADPEGEVARQKATAAGNAAMRRCLTSHGWKKKSS